MEIRNIGNGKKRLLIIAENALNFINYDDGNEVINFCKDKAVDVVVSSDCHGDEESFELPFKLSTKQRIFLGDYYPYIPSWFKFREKDQKVKADFVEKIKASYIHMDDLLSKHLNDENTIFLFGNHDPRIFPVSFEMEIQGYKFLFQHSLIQHDKDGKTLMVDNAASTHYLDLEEELWKDASGPMIEDAIGSMKSPYTINQTPKPLFVLPQNDRQFFDIPKGFNYIIIGHLSSYEWLYEPSDDFDISELLALKEKLFTIDSHNSCVVDEANAYIHERKLIHYRTRINEILSKLPTMKPKLQAQQIKLLDQLKNSLSLEESKDQKCDKIGFI